MFGSSLPPVVLGGPIPCLRYLCLFVCLFVCLSNTMLPISQDFSIAPSVFSNVYLLENVTFLLSQ